MRPSVASEILCELLAEYFVLGFLAGVGFSLAVKYLPRFERWIDKQR